MKICWGVTSSFCTLQKIYPILEKISAENDVFSLCSFNFKATDSRFGKSADHLNTLERLTNKPVISSICNAETVGPMLKPDIMVIAPCTGNTLAKLASGIFDTPVTLGAKAHLRNGKPLLIALATNDGLSLNFKNLAELYGRKNVFFVPLIQDDPVTKPSSLVCDFTLIPDAIKAALENRQILPLFR